MAFSLFFSFCPISLASQEAPWIEIGDSLVEHAGSGGKKEDLENFKIETQKCQNLDAVVRIYIKYSTADNTDLEVRLGINNGAGTNREDAVTGLSDPSKNVIITAVTRRYCDTDQTIKPPVRIQLKSGAGSPVIIGSSFMIEDSNADENTSGPTTNPDSAPASPTPASTPTSATNQNSISNQTGSQIKLVNPLGSTSDIPSLLDKIFTQLVWIISFIVPIIIIVAAFQMMFAAGNPEKFATGRNTILYTMIGYAILLAARGIMAIIKEILTV